MLLEPAVDLASRFGAHLIGLHVAGGVSAVGGVDALYGSERTESALAVERQEAREISAVFAHMTADQPITSEWRALEAPFSDPAVVVLNHGRCSDLIVAGQADA